MSAGSVVSPGPAVRSGSPVVAVCDHDQSGGRSSTGNVAHLREACAVAGRPLALRTYRELLDDGLPDLAGSAALAPRETANFRRPRAFPAPTVSSGIVAVRIRGPSPLRWRRRPRLDAGRQPHSTVRARRRLLSVGVGHPTAVGRLLRGEAPSVELLGSLPTTSPPGVTSSPLVSGSVSPCSER